MRKIFNLVNNERGNAIVIVALTFVSLLGMAGLVIDGSLLYMTKTHLQKTANAAVFSGAQELTNQEDRVENVISDILKAHKEETSLDAIQVTMDKRVAIILKKTVPLSFSRIFGITEIDVKVNAAAELRPLGRAVGAVPLGIDERVNPEFNKTYQLKVDSSDSISGYFGILALEGPGAKTYEENLRNGFQEELSIGTIVDTQTGNIAGKTRSVVQQLINECPESPRDIYDRDCSRILLVPVYKPYKVESNQLKQVQITGFSYFYITEPMNEHDTSITGIFIKRADTGFEENGSVSRGAYKIRITE
jgi:hypothetical protein